MSVIGHYLLFSPIIALLSWISLVGHLLGAVMAFAAAIFALLWASVLHCLIMGVSWLFYRPVYGMILLTCVVGGIVLMIMGGGTSVHHVTSVVQ